MGSRTYPKTILLWQCCTDITKFLSLIFSLKSKHRLFPNSQILYRSIPAFITALAGELRRPAHSLNYMLLPQSCADCLWFLLLCSHSSTTHSLWQPSCFVNLEVSPPFSSLFSLFQKETKKSSLKSCFPIPLNIYCHNNEMIWLLLKGGYNFRGMKADNWICVCF